MDKIVRNLRSPLLTVMHKINDLQDGSTVTVEINYFWWGALALLAALFIFTKK